MNKGKQEGITLIALIITIIIMLILVAVTVNVAMDGNLFGKAEEAVDKTNAKVGKLQQDIDYYTGELNNASDRVNEVEHNWTRNGETFKCLNCRRELKIGQQIMYTDSGATSTVVTSAKRGVNPDQTITKPSNIRWVVFGIEDSDGNGTNESLLLTTAEPVMASSFIGNNKYNYEEEELNRMCKELYGSNARSMTLADIENTLQYRPSGAMYGIVKETTTGDSGVSNKVAEVQHTSLNLGMVIQHNITAMNSDRIKMINEYVEYKTTGNFTTKLNQLGEIWNEVKIAGTNTPDGVNTETALGNYTLNSYVYSVALDGTITNPVNNETRNISKTTRDLIFGTYNNYSYNLATKVVGATTKGADFGVASIAAGEVTNLPSGIISQIIEVIIKEMNETTQQTSLINNNETKFETIGLDMKEDEPKIMQTMVIQHNLAGSMRPVVRITNEQLSVGSVITEYGNNNTETENDGSAESVITDTEMAI